SDRRSSLEPRKEKHYRDRSRDGERERGGSREHRRDRDRRSTEDDRTRAKKDRSYNKSPTREPSSNKRIRQLQPRDCLEEILNSNASYKRCFPLEPYYQQRSICLEDNNKSVNITEGTEQLASLR